MEERCEQCEMPLHMEGIGVRPSEAGRAAAEYVEKMAFPWGFCDGSGIL
jgi:hypothetical protein